MKDLSILENQVEVRKNAYIDYSEGVSVRVPYRDLRDLVLEQIKEVDGVCNKVCILYYVLRIYFGQVFHKHRGIATTPLDDWIDNSDVMRMLNISKRTLQTLRSNGKIPFSRIGNKIYYRREDIQNILACNYIRFEIQNEYGKTRKKRA